MPITRPDTNTLFHIDLDWFAKNGYDLREEMYGAFCDECRSYYPTLESTHAVDRVHTQTGEVTRVDALWECLVDHCRLLPTFITPAMPIRAAIFRAFLASANCPLSPEKLWKRVGKSNPAAILKLLIGGEVENGILPVGTSNQ
jgi:hypothetical protein